MSGFPESYPQRPDWTDAPLYADDSTPFRIEPADFVERYPSVRLLLCLSSRLGHYPTGYPKGDRQLEWVEEVRSLRPDHYKVGCSMRTSNGAAFAYGAGPEHVQRIPLEVWAPWYAAHLEAGWTFETGKSLTPDVLELHHQHWRKTGESWGWHGHAEPAPSEIDDDGTEIPGGGRFQLLHFSWDWGPEANYRALATAHACWALELHRLYDVTVLAFGGKLAEELPLRIADDQGDWLDYHKHSSRVRCYPEEGAELGCDPLFAPPGRMVWGGEPYVWRDRMVSFCRDYLPGLFSVVVPGTDADDPRFRKGGAWPFDSPFVGAGKIVAV